MTALVPLLLGAVITSAAVLATGSGCGSFGEADPLATDGGSGAEGGVAVEPATKRDLTVVAAWPTISLLDPAMDIRVRKIRVVVEDATDSTRRTEISVASTDPGPYVFRAFETTNLVDVTLELLADDTRLIGYGERRRWNVADDATVVVNARRRLLYITGADRDAGQLRVLGMTNGDQMDPGLDEPDVPQLPSLTEPSSLHITTDGALLVQAGRTRTADAGAGGGAIAVFETGSHVARPTIPLSFAPSAVVPLGDGYKMVALPNNNIQATTFALVDILASSSTPVVTGLAGGSLDITSAAASPDGKRAIAVGTYTASTKTKAYAFSYAAGASQATAVDLSALLDEAGGVRFLPDGKRAIVAGFKRTGAIPTGILLVFDPLLGASPEQIRLAASTQPSSLLIHPNGKHAYVSNRTQYSPPCCGQLRIVALETKAEVYASGFFDPGGPEFQLNAAVRLPYAPFRVLAGQSDDGNTLHGPVVELAAGGMAPTKVEVMANADIGSINAFATPFGTPF